MGIKSQTGVVVAAIAAVFVMSCAEDEGPVAADASYTLTCPEPPTGCGAISETTCLRPDGSSIGTRRILGVNGELSCDGVSPIIATCRAAEGVENDLLVTLEATVPQEGSTQTAFGFELRALFSQTGSTVTGTCDVIFTEDDVAYGGDDACGVEPPSSEQPCRISNVIVSDPDGAVDLGFDIECLALTSPTTENGFDIEGTIQFARCNGL